MNKMSETRKKSSLMILVIDCFDQRIVAITKANEATMKKRMIGLRWNISPKTAPMIKREGATNDKISNVLESFSEKFPKMKWTIKEIKESAAPK